MRNKKAWIFLESRRKYWDYSVISLCVYGNPGESGFPVSQEPLKTLFAIREDMDGGVFRYLKGHERREELKVIF